MAQLKAPTDFIVIRSEDRTSAMFVWDPVLLDTDGASCVADAYSLHKSELNNELGYAVAKTVTHRTGATRQYTSLDGLDPDLLYNFPVTATKTGVTTSDPSLSATDF